MPAAAGLQAPPNPSLNYLVLDYQDHISSTAAFGQLDWKATDTIKLTGGLRYTYDEKHGQEEARYIAFPGSLCLNQRRELGLVLGAGR